MSQRRLPAEIYWRRRLLLVAVLIAIVWGVLQVTNRGSDDKQSKAPASTKTTAAPTRSPVPTTPVAPTTPVVKTDGPVDVALATAATPCDPEKIRVTPSVRPGQLNKGPVDIGLVVSSTSTKGCTLKPEDADAIAVISANGTAIWDSTLCKTSLLTAPIEVSPQWATMVVVQWSGRGSGTNCTSNEGWATPGKYTIQIGTLGGEPGKASFTLDARSAPPKTEAPAVPDVPPATPTAPASPAAPEAPATPGTPAEPGAEPPVTQG